MSEFDDRLRLLESEIERRLAGRFAALRDEFERLRVEADRRWEGFLSRFDQDFHGIVPRDLVAPPSPEAPAAPAPTGGKVAIAAVRSLDEASNQVEALSRFLDLCRGHASRVALLITRGGTLAVWKAVGFSEYGGSDDQVRRASLPVDREETLHRVIDGTPCRLPAGHSISVRLSANDAVEAVLVPMVVKEKISGVVYADSVDEERAKFDPDAIGLLTFLAGSTVDRLASRRYRPAPPLKPAESERAEPEFAEPEFAEPIEYQESPAPAAGPSASSAATVALELPRPEPPPPMEPEAELMEVEEEPPARIEQPAEFGSPPPAPPHPAPAESAIPELEFDTTQGRAARPPDFASSTAARQATGARRLAGPLAPPEGDERREEARRFAQLLVSEIKLYNERAVVEGREHGDLYDRLKEDIDRSQQMYDDRIPEDVRASSNFFYEELVRVLADGQAEALGMG